MTEMNKLRRVVRHILKETKAEAEKEKAERIRAAGEAYKKKLRAAHKLHMDDMLGLFRIKHEKNWFELDDAPSEKSVKLQSAKNK